MKSALFLKLFFVLGVIFLQSCSLFDYDATVPSYITINSIDFSPGDGHGTGSYQITDAWVYINGKKAGTYELPATFPVLYKGNCTIEILPGIKLNGTSATRSIYPFYKKYEISAELFPDSTISISPKTTYSDNITFEFIEDFESAGMIFDATSRSDTGIVKQDNPEHAFEGSYGEITLSDTNTFFEAKSIEAYSLPKTGSYNFIELNYQTDIPLFVGVFSNTSGYITQHSIVQINPSSVWKKIYINLTPTVSRETSAIDFNIFLASELPEGVSQGTIRIDNIKLIHY